MIELIEDITSLCNSILVDLDKTKEKSTKASAQRIRVNSIKLEKLLKEFRKRSVHEIKGRTSGE